MKKHYVFIPLKESDLKDFRKSLLSSLWFRPVFCILLILFLICLGCTYHDALYGNTLCFLFYALSIAFILYLMAREIKRLKIIFEFKKSYLLPFIHASGADDCFYSEEVAAGFIIQTQPVNFADISNCKKELSLIFTQSAQSLPLYNYLKSCFGSNDERLINKAVIYTEIIKDQLAHGNPSILATHDKLVNFKGDLS